MAIQNRNYFFTPTVNNERFLSQDEPTEQVMRNFADSVAFKQELSDTATEIQQGLVETATQAEYDAGTDNNANGWALYVRPSMIKNAITTVSAFLQSQITTNTNNIQQNSNDIVNIQGDITDIQNEFGETMPLGSMIMYPGTNFSLPDLRKKFIAGYDDNGPAEYQTIGSGAGANEVLLTEAQSGVPAHTHNANASTDIDPAGAHTHDIIEYKDVGTANGVVDFRTIDSSPSTGSTDDQSVRTAGLHDHSVTTNVTIEPISGAPASEAHENRPEFVVFPHIIKVLN